MRAATFFRLFGRPARRTGLARVRPGMIVPGGRCTGRRARRLHGPTARPGRNKMPEKKQYETRVNRLLVSQGNDPSRPLAHHAGIGKTDKGTVIYDFVIPAAREGEVQAIISGLGGRADYAIKPPEPGFRGMEPYLHLQITPRPGTDVGELADFLLEKKLITSRPHGGEGLRGVKDGRLVEIKIFIYDNIKNNPQKPPGVLSRLAGLFRRRPDGPHAAASRGEAAQPQQVLR